MECLLATSTTFKEVPNGSSKVSIHHPLGFIYVYLMGILLKVLDFDGSS